MRRFVGIGLALVCLIVVAQAKFLDDNVEYAESRFIVKLWPDTGELNPVFNE